MSSLQSPGLGQSLSEPRQSADRLHREQVTQRFIQRYLDQTSHSPVKPFNYLMNESEFDSYILDTPSAPGNGRPTEYVLIQLIRCCAQVIQFDWSHKRKPIINVLFTSILKNVRRNGFELPASGIASAHIFEELAQELFQYHFDFCINLFQLLLKQPSAATLPPLTSLAPRITMVFLNSHQRCLRSFAWSKESPIPLIQSFPRLLDVVGIKPLQAFCTQFLVFCIDESKADYFLEFLSGLSTAQLLLLNLSAVVDDACRRIGVIDHIRLEPNQQPTVFEFAQLVVQLWPKNSAAALILEVLLELRKWQESKTPTKSATSTPASNIKQPKTAQGKTQVTVFSGFLGSGKTTILMHVMEQLRAANGSDYQVCWLKNEYGDVAVDSRLASEKNIAVKEMLAGCICCTQVGKLGDALKELIDTYHPDRILLETSGSSLPAPLARELRRLTEIGLPIELDAIICVIDAVNFPGYADKSATAKIQAKFTDLILINKHELVTPQALDRIMDDIFELNPDTPKIQTHKGFIDYRLVLGLDSKLLSNEFLADASTSDGPSHQDNDVYVLDLNLPLVNSNINPAPFTWSTWLSLLSQLPIESFYRIKGVIYLTETQPTQTSIAIASLPSVPAPAVIQPSTPTLTLDNHIHSSQCQCGLASPSSSSTTSAAPTTALHPHLLNYAFGRFDLTPLPFTAATSATHVSFMGDQTMRSWMPTISTTLNLTDSTTLKSLVVPNKLNISTEESNTTGSSLSRSSSSSSSTSSSTTTDSSDESSSDDSSIPPTPAVPHLIPTSISPDEALRHYFSKMLASLPFRLVSFNFLYHRLLLRRKHSTSSQFRESDLMVAPHDPLTDALVAGQTYLRLDETIAPRFFDLRNEKSPPVLITYLFSLPNPQFQRLRPLAFNILEQLKAYRGTAPPEDLIRLIQCLMQGRTRPYMFRDFVWKLYEILLPVDPPATQWESSKIRHFLQRMITSWLPFRYPPKNQQEETDFNTSVLALEFMIPYAERDFSAEFVRREITHLFLKKGHISGLRWWVTTKWCRQLAADFQPFAIICEYVADLMHFHRPHNVTSTRKAFLVGLESHQTLLKDYKSDEIRNEIIRATNLPTEIIDYEILPLFHISQDRIDEVRKDLELFTVSRPLRSGEFETRYLANNREWRISCLTPPHCFTCHQPLTFDQTAIQLSCNHTFHATEPCAPHGTECTLCQTMSQARKNAAARNAEMAAAATVVEEEKGNERAQSNSSLTMNLSTPSVTVTTAATSSSSSLPNTTTDSPPAVTVPAARLVGVEINPGPVVTTIQTLFTDDLHTILSFLDGRSWCECIRTCQHLLQAAQTEPNRHLWFEVQRRHIPLIRIGSAGKLLRHISYLILPNGHYDYAYDSRCILFLDEILNLVSYLPTLHTITGPFSHGSMDLDPTVHTHPWPQTLRIWQLYPNFSFPADPVSVRHSYPNLLTSILMAPSLTSLYLSRTLFQGDQRPQPMAAPFKLLTNLKYLTISHWILFHLCRSLPSTSADVNAPIDQEMNYDHFPPSLTHLSPYYDDTNPVHWELDSFRRFNLVHLKTINVVSSKGPLDQLHRLAPNLKSISSHFRIRLVQLEEFGLEKVSDFGLGLIRVRASDGSDQLSDSSTIPLDPTSTFPQITHLSLSSVPDEASEQAWFFFSRQFPSVVSVSMYGLEDFLRRDVLHKILRSFASKIQHLQLELLGMNERVNITQEINEAVPQECRQLKTITCIHPYPSLLFFSRTRECYELSRTKFPLLERLAFIGEDPSELKDIPTGRINPRTDLIMHFHQTPTSPPAILPPKDLTAAGIEPNPGPDSNLSSPSSTHSLSSTPSAQILFKDSAILVYAYLTDHEWMAALKTCQLFYQTACSSPSRHIDYVSLCRKNINDQPCISFTSKLVYHFTRLSSRRHDDLGQLIRLVSSLSHLVTLDVVIGPSASDISSDCLIPCWSSHLTELHPSSFMGSGYPNLFQSIYLISSLTTLKLTSTPNKLSGFIPSETFRPLVHLTSLEITSYHINDDILQFGDPNSTYLFLPPTLTELVTHLRPMEHLHKCAPTNLKHLSGISNSLRPGDLKRIAEVAPRLEWLENVNICTTDLDDLRLFSHLHTIVFTSPEWYQAEPSPDTALAAMNILTQLSTVTRLVLKGPLNRQFSLILPILPPQIVELELKCAFDLTWSSEPWMSKVSLPFVQRVQLSCVADGNDLHFEFVKSFFTSPLRCPQLQHLEIKCADRKFRFERPADPPSASYTDAVDSPPAARLVGIELNPGPSVTVPSPRLVGVELNPGPPRSSAYRTRSSTSQSSSTTVSNSRPSESQLQKWLDLANNNGTRKGTSKSHKNSFLGIAGELGLKPYANNPSPSKKNIKDMVLDELHHLLSSSSNQIPSRFAHDHPTLVGAPPELVVPRTCGCGSSSSCFNCRPIPPPPQIPYLPAFIGRPKPPQVGNMCNDYCSSRRRSYPHEFHCCYCHKGTQHNSSRTILGVYYLWQSVVEALNSVPPENRLELDYNRKLGYGNTNDFVDFTCNFPSTIPCSACKQSRLEVFVHCEALLRMSLIMGADGLPSLSGCVRYFEEPPSRLWQWKILPPSSSTYRSVSFSTSLISPFGIRGRLLAVLSEIEFTLEQLTWLGALWTEVEKKLQIVADEDMRILPCTKDAPTTFSTKNCQDLKGLLTQCEVSRFGCWRVPIPPTQTHAQKEYTAVMRHKESFGLMLPEEEQSEFIYAHPGLPEGVDRAQPKEGEDRLVRHHPLRCELFHQGDQHGRCIRPSHLAWGEGKERGQRSNKRDKALRVRMTRKLLQEMVRPEEVDRCYANRHNSNIMPSIHSLSVCSISSSSYQPSQPFVSNITSTSLVQSSTIAAAPAYLMSIASSSTTLPRPSAYVPPQPRLVGIELNPGPMESPPPDRLVRVELNPRTVRSDSSTCDSLRPDLTGHTSSASRFTNLFNDGVVIVYSLLSLTDGVSLALTSRHFLSLASAGSCRELHIEGIEYFYIISLFTSCFKRHFTVIELTEDITLEQLNSIIQQFPNLTSADFTIRDDEVTSSTTVSFGHLSRLKLDLTYGLCQRGNELIFSSLPMTLTELSIRMWESNTSLIYRLSSYFKLLRVLCCDRPRDGSCHQSFTQPPLISFRCRSNRATRFI